MRPHQVLTSRHLFAGLLSPRVPCDGLWQLGRGTEIVCRQINTETEYPVLLLCNCAERSFYVSKLTRASYRTHTIACAHALHRRDTYPQLCIYNALTNLRFLWDVFWTCQTLGRSQSQCAALQARFRSRTSQPLYLVLITLCSESTLRKPLPTFLPDIIMRL